MVAGQKNDYRRQIRYRRKDGTIFWGDMSLSLIQDQAGAFEAIIGVVIDISEQKQAAENLRISEEKYRRVFDKSGAASVIIDQDMTITMANEEFEKLTGYGRDEIENRMKWSAFIAPEDLDKMRRYHRQRRLPAGRAPEEYECRIIRRSGEKRDIFIKVGMLPDGVRSIASFMDITSLKKTASALKDSEAKLLAIIEATEGWIYTCNPDFILEFMNRALVDKIGENAVGRICYQALYQRKRRCPWCAWDDVFRGQAGRREFENPLDHRWYDAMMSPMRDDAGNVTRLEAFVIDITERKQAEKMLKEQEVYLRRENVRLKSSIRDRFRFGNIIGKSRSMQQVYERILNAAATDANVIIYGESGTGKELVARAIHEAGPRRDKPFIKVNCAALNDNLLESELFGHVKGAFTGADRNRIGRFEAAHEGTIFLDEIGDIPSATQVKLLRVLEDKKIERVGDIKTVPVDVRIITATNKNLESLVETQVFREDLFFRINVFPLHCPALADRREDIPLIVEHFIRQNAGNSSKQILGVTPKAMEALMSYGWPGNVRELRNAIDYAYVLCPGGGIDKDHLPVKIRKRNGMLSAKKNHPRRIRGDVAGNPVGL
ncbi:MAG: sigma 54-interacting transcriptional regulator [Desulfobacterales bacterium]